MKGKDFRLTVREITILPDEINQKGSNDTYLKQAVVALPHVFHSNRHFHPAWL